MNEDGKPRVGIIAHRGLGLAALTAAIAGIATLGLSMDEATESARRFGTVTARLPKDVPPRLPTGPPKKFRHNRRG